MPASNHKMPATAHTKPSKLSKPAKIEAQLRQLRYLKKDPHAYGGVLSNTRAGRSRPRPLSRRHSMHLVLRSSRATGALSMRRHAGKVEAIVRRFASKYQVRLFSLANVGNHLHFHIQLRNEENYRPFIRAITAAIAMAVTGRSRWKKSVGKFWDYRPFTRLVKNAASFLRLRDYIRINQFEGLGYGRINATLIVAREIDRRRPRSAWG